MVEAGAAEVPEEEMLDAIMFGFDAIKKLCAFQDAIIAKIGKAKRHIDLYAPDPIIEKDIKTRIGERMVKAISIFDKLERQDAVEVLKKEILDDYDARKYDNEKAHGKTMMMVNDILEGLVAAEVRRLITDEKIRPDGRKVDEIRPIDCQIDLLPRAHGSAMFTRGQTQVIGTTTLGPLSDKQIIDDLTGETERRFMYVKSSTRPKVNKNNEVKLYLKHLGLGDLQLTEGDEFTVMVENNSIILTKIEH